MRWLILQRTRESKISGGGGGFVRFSYFMYVTCCRLAFDICALFWMVLDCLRVAVDVFLGGCRWLLKFLKVVTKTRNDLK